MLRGSQPGLRESRKCFRAEDVRDWDRMTHSASSTLISENMTKCSSKTERHFAPYLIAVSIMAILFSLSLVTSLTCSKLTKVVR